MNLEIKDIEPQHYTAIANIYSQGQQTGFATFETTVPSWEQWNASHIPTCRFAALSNNELVGWAALSPVSKRHVYRGVAEVSVYVATQYSGKNIGATLLENLIRESEKQEFWTLQSSIFPQNKASIRLHEKTGFRQIGYREHIGMRAGIWYDNILMERRSKNVGINENNIE